MKGILRLVKIGVLSKAEAKLAIAYHKGEVENVHPVTAKLLNDFIIHKLGFLAMEKKYDWPARSAKAIFSVLLQTLTPAATVPAGKLPAAVEELQEQLEYVTGTSQIEMMEVAGELGLTQSEASLFLILRAAKGGLVSYDTLYTRLFCLRPESEWPDSKIIAVYIHKLRKKLKTYTITTVWGTGVYLRKNNEEANHG